MSAQDRWARLRTLLEQPESEAAWGDVCAFLNNWPAVEGLEEALNYVVDYLGAWYRPTPWAWRRTLLTQPDPRLRLVNALTVGLMTAGGIGDQGVAMLADLPLLANVTDLDLDRNGVGALGARALAQSPYLTKLTILSLNGNAIGPEGIAALARSPNVAGLKALSLVGAEVGDAGAAAIAQSPYLTYLVFLDVSKNKITESGVEALADSPNLARVTELHLSDNAVGDVGAVALGISKQTHHVRSLYLRNAGVEDSGVFVLVSQLQRLSALDLQNNRLSGVSSVTLESDGFRRDQDMWLRPQTVE